MEKTKKFLCCVYAVLRKGVRNMIREAKASLSGKSAKAKKKSPIRSLQNLPGSSARQEADTKRMTIIWIGLLSMGVLMGVFASWIFWGFGFGILGVLSPFLLGVTGLIVSWILIFAWDDEIENYRIGYQGERFVAEVIAHFTRTDWRVFHDFRIPGKNWNIDHIVICPKGVICIETKTMRRYPDETRKLRFDGKRICWGDGSNWKPLPWDPVEKVKEYAEQMKTLLRNEGIQLDDNSVMPMVIYPGWEFAEDSAKSNDVIVGNQKKISSLCSSEERKLGDHKIMEIAKVLKPKNEFALDE